jgi:uncharacterized damage-inducible protein DinB
MRPFELMAYNNAWANATLHGALKGLSDEQFQAAAPGFFPSLGRTLNHIYEVDLYYIDALADGGRGRNVYDREDFTTLSALAAAQKSLDAALIRFCRGLQAPMLDDIRRTDRGDRMHPETVGALLLHLFQHQIHHRGQAHVQVHALGIAPPQLDDFHLNFERAETATGYFR